MREMNVSRHLDGEIASYIGKWYFEKKVGGELDFRVKATRDAIVEMNIHGIHFDGEHIEIKLGRPGHLIGRRGENINALTVALRKEFEFKELRIVEDRVVDRLFDFQLAYLTCDDSDCLY